MRKAIAAESSLYAIIFLIRGAFLEAKERLCIITERPEKDKENAIREKRSLSVKIHKSDMYDTAFPTSKNGRIIIATRADARCFLISPQTIEKKEMKNDMFSEDNALCFTEETKLKLCLLINSVFLEKSRFLPIIIPLIKADISVIV